MILRLQGIILYKDNAEFTDKVALNEKLILVICGLARFTYRVVKYIIVEAKKIKSPD